VPFSGFALNSGGAHYKEASGFTTAQQGSKQAADKNAIRPFHVNVPEAELTELRRRINSTKWA
jgi:hypothetical protein